MYGATKTPDSQRNHGEEEQSSRHHTSKQHKNRHTDPWNRKEPRNKHLHLWPSNIWQGSWGHSMGKKSLQQMIMRQVDSHLQKNEIRPILHHSQKLTWNGLKTKHNIRCHKTPRRKHTKEFLEIGLSNTVLNMIPKA